MGAGEESEPNPFKCGQRVECCSMVIGYRGAWFRSKVLKFTYPREGTRVILEYLDFTDRSYQQKLYHKIKRKHENRRLMIRPEFPEVVFQRDWQAGDHAEWFKEGAYWICTVAELLDDATFRVVCRNPPAGEGGEYIAKKPDLRPGLEWSLEKGWTTKPSPRNLPPLVTIVERSVHGECTASKASDPNCSANDHQAQPQAEEMELVHDNVQSASDTDIRPDEEDEEEEEGIEVEVQEEEDVLTLLSGLLDKTDELEFLRDVLLLGLEEAQQRLGSRHAPGWRILSSEGNKLKLQSLRSH